MKIIKVTQGTPEWAALRARHNTASEAPAMMGVSKYQTRDELLRQKATGIVPEVTSHQQSIFDRGHAAEAAARTILEEDTCEEFYPITAVSDDDTMLASMDGITLDDSTLFEHKLWNDKLAAQVRAGQLDPHYYWQLEQQLLVTGATRVIFVCSDGTRDNWAQMEYLPVAGRAGQLLFSWAQFDADRALYIPPASAPVVVATAVTALPAVMVQVTGSIAVRDNFAIFETALRDFIENRLILKPATDQDFADLDLQIKALKGAEAALDAAEVSMLAQVAGVDSVQKLKQMLHKLARDNRLMAEKQLAARKEEIKGEITAEGIAALRTHVAALNTRLGKPYMPVIPADFAGSIKGKRTVDSLRDAVNTELARAKIEASAVADRIQINLSTLRELAAAHAFLFADTAQIVLKAPDDLAMLVKSRIADHQTAEAAKEEATRARIRAEEQAKVEREAREKLAKEAADAAAAQKLIDDAAALAANQAEPPVNRIVAVLEDDNTAPVMLVERTAPAANVVAMVRPATPTAATPDLAATIRLGQINDALGPCLQVSGANLTALGFSAVGRDKAAVLYRASDFTLMLAAMVDHLQAVQSRQAA